MKKIAILTFSHAFNYGAVLQAYALKKTIYNLGFKASVVDYRAPFYPDTRWWQQILFLCKRTIKSLLGYPFYPLFFYKFMQQYLQDTPALQRKQLSELNNQFDLFITGSDQVWNFTITKDDPAFLLDFVTDPKKKVSYAASFGFSYADEKNKPVFSQLLQQFAHISVREQTGAKIVKELTGKEVPVVLDPTLLLKKNQWESFSTPVHQTAYVLLYLMDENEKIISFAKKLAQQKGLPLCGISTNKLKGITNFKCTPEEFVGYFQNASYVVTNSFHGLAFSVNLNKTFFVDLLPPSWPANSRLENLLDLMGLRDRLIDNIGADYEKRIDWQLVNTIVNQKREDSLQYLRDIVQ